MQVVVHTGEVPPAYRLARYREVVRALPVPLETGADPTADFLVRMSSETFGEMAVARISSAAPTSYQIKRTRELIRRSDPEAYRLVLTRRGRMSLSHAGRSALLGPRVTSVQHTPDGRHHTVSWPIVNAAMLAHAQRVLPEQVPPVAHLGIDETRRGRATWR